MIIAKKMGVAKLIVNIEAITAKKVLRNDETLLGTISSMTLISLEKRFMILPWGVVSKNDMGECMMLTSIR